MKKRVFFEYQAIKLMSYKTRHEKKKKKNRRTDKLNIYVHYTSNRIKKKYSKILISRNKTKK